MTIESTEKGQISPAIPEKMSQEQDTSIDQKLSELKVSEGEVLVVKGSGKIKIRKGQSEEDYQKQLRQFQTEGPTINEIDWLKNKKLDDVEIDNKVATTEYINLLELLYYERKYTECVSKCDDFITKFNTDEVILDRNSNDKKRKRSKAIMTIEQAEVIRGHCLAKLERSA